MQIYDFYFIMQIFSIILLLNHALDVTHKYEKGAAPQMGRAL